MSDFPSLSALNVKTEQNRFEFLQADLSLCSTFAELVKTEMGLGDVEAAQKVLAKAEDGYATIARLLFQLQNAAHQVEIGWGLNELRVTLDSLRNKFKELK